MSTHRLHKSAIGNIGKITAQHMEEATDTNTLVVSSQLWAAQGTTSHMGEATDVNAMPASSQLVAAQGIASHMREANDANTPVV